jgi:PST family polysaccharide transporter
LAVSVADTVELTAARIAKGSIYLTLKSILSTLIAVSGFAFMARIITQEEMGVIAGVTLLTSLVVLVSDFGLSSSIAKHVSELKGKGQDISSVVVSSIAFRIPICIVLASSLFIFASEISTILFKSTIYVSAIGLLSIDAILLSLIQLLDNVLLGAGRLKSIAVFSIASILIRWLSIIVLLLVNGGTSGIILGWIIGDLTLMMLLTFSVTRLVNFKKETLETFKKQIPQLLRFALPLYMALAVSFLHTWYDKALILAYLPLSDMGIYTTVYLAYTVLVTIATALGSALLPYYGMAYGRNDHKAISQGMKRASRYTALAIFPLTLGLLATSRPTLTLFAGPQYETGWTVLAVLSLFGLAHGISPALSNVLLIYGRTKTILLLSFIPVVSSLVLLPLVWVLGLFGLAVMRGTTLTLSLILTAYFINKTVRVEIDKRALTRALIASAIMAVAILTIQQITYSTSHLPIYILVGAILYIALIRALNILDHGDFQLLRQIVGKRAAKYVVKILGGRS